MKTIAEQLNITDFPFEIRDKEGRVIYFEIKNQFWVRCEYDSAGNEIYHEDSYGYIHDIRPKDTNPEICTTKNLKSAQ